MELAPITTIIEIDGKEYTVETAVLPAKGRLISAIVMGGRNISMRDLEIPEGLDDESLRRFQHENHRARTVELESIFKLNRKIDEKPTADACSKVGVILLANGFHEAAKQRFLKAIELDPGHLPSNKSYGVVLFMLGDFDGALAAFHRAREMGPGYADIYYHLGNVHLYRWELDQATQFYLQALQINPRYADARLKLATACVGYLAQRDEASQDSRATELVERSKNEAETAAGLNPKLRNRAFMMATDQVRTRRYKLAYQSFLDVRPKYVPRVGDEVIFYFTLTLLYGNEGIDLQMTEQYIEKLARVIEEYPHYADLHHHLGVAYLIKTRFVVGRALKEYKKSLEINPQFQKATDNLAELEDLNKRLLAVLRKAIIP